MFQHTRDFVTLALILLSVLVGLPCLALGIAGLAGSLADASYAENVRFAIPYLVVAAGALAPAIWWFSSARAKFRREPSKGIAEERNLP